MTDPSKLILSVEDDPLQVDWIRSNITKEIENVDLWQISTEHTFIACFDRIVSRSPNVVLLDIMIRWADPAPDMPPRPDDVRQGGIAKAGLRCYERLSADPATSKIPVILYSVMGNPAEELGTPFPDNLTILRKSSDPAELIRSLRMALACPD